MLLNFGLLQPVDIGARFTAGQESVQRNQLAQQQMAASQQQLQTGAMQQEKAQMELAGFKRRQAGLDIFLQKSAEKGKTGSPEEQAEDFYNYARAQEDPQLILAAQTMRQAARERKDYLASRQPPKISPVGPAPGALGSGTFDPMVNQLAPPPAPAAPVNQLGANTIALENRIIDLRTNYPNVPQAQKEADRLEKQLDEANKLYTVGGNLVTGTGKPVFTADKKENAPPAMVAEYTFAKTPEGGGFTGSYQQFVTARAAAGRAPAQPAPLQPLVAVKGPDGNPIYVSREEALKKRMSPPDSSGGTSEGERKAATLLQRLQFSQNQLTKALTDNPKAAGPEAFAAAVGKFSTTASNLLNSQARQRVEAAQLDILDAALTLGTGAAYTREQLEGYRQAYFPAYGDEPQTILDKQARLQNVIEAAQIAAGKASKLVPAQTPVAPAPGGSDVRSKADQILKRKP